MWEGQMCRTKSPMRGFITPLEESIRAKWKTYIVLLVVVVVW
jgi:hypothetical protein